jgi:hypothetical protein
MSRLLSIPIFPKIMGIGFLVAMLFGGVTLIQTRAGTSKILNQILEQKILSTTEVLAEMVELPVKTGDVYAVLRVINHAQKIYPEINYVIVRSSSGQVLASTFKNAPPQDLLKIPTPHCPPNCGTQSLQNGEGTIYESRAPILEGEAGMVQVGFTDDMVSRELTRFTETVL